MQSVLELTFEQRRASRKSRVEPLSIDGNGSADVEPTTPKKKKKKKPAQLSTDALMPTSTDALMTPSTEALDSAYEPTSPSTPTTDHQAALAARRARLASRSSQGMIEVPIEERVRFLPALCSFFDAGHLGCSKGRARKGRARHRAERPDRAGAASAGHVLASPHLGLFKGRTQR